MVTGVGVSVVAYYVEPRLFGEGREGRARVALSVGGEHVGEVHAVREADASPGDEVAVVRETVADVLARVLYTVGLSADPAPAGMAGGSRAAALSAASVARSRREAGEGLWPVPSCCAGSGLASDAARPCDNPECEVPPDGYGLTDDGRCPRCQQLEPGVVCVGCGIWIGDHRDDGEPYTLAPHEPHRYRSTACLHGEHGYCAATVGRAGPKVPAVCKWCEAPCVCACHADGSVDVDGDGAPVVSVDGEGVGHISPDHGGPAITSPPDHGRAVREHDPVGDAPGSAGPGDVLAAMQVEAHGVDDVGGFGVRVDGRDGVGHGGSS